MVYISFLLSLLALASASPFLEERTSGCKNDNLQCCLRDNPGPASSYCSSYAGGTTTTTVKTVTPTTTVTTTFTSTSISTSGTTTTTSTVTSTAVTTTTQIVAVTAFSTITTTVTQLSTLTVPTTVIVATVTVAPPAKVKRNAPGPTCLTKAGGKSTSYAPSAITSACSCIGITRSTVSATSTAPASTVTTTKTITSIKTTPSTVTVTTTKAVTSTSTYAPTSTLTATSTVPITITSIITTTATIPATSTVTSAVGETCTAQTTVAPSNFPGFPYRKVYETTGFRESDTNPGNSDPAYPPAVETYAAGSRDTCGAIQSCASLAFSFEAYYSFVLYRLLDGSFECRAYYDSNPTPAPFFTIVDPTVVRAYAYDYI